MMEGFFGEAALHRGPSEEVLREIFSRHVYLPKEELHALLEQFRNDPNFMADILKQYADKAHPHHTAHLSPQVVSAYVANTIAAALGTDHEPLPTPGLEEHGESLFDHEERKVK